MGKLVLGKYLLSGDRIDFEISDCKDQIISPGFINAHMHLYGVISHGISVPGDIEDFKSFLEDFWWPWIVF